MHRGWRAAVFAAALGAGGVASAHEFECVKRVNGQAVAAVDEYPTKLRFDYRLTNLHPSVESVAEQAEDPVLVGYGWSFGHSLPLAVAVDGSVETKFLLQVGSYEECRALAAQDGLDDGMFDTTFRVVWPLGEDQCSARLRCEPPFVPPPRRPCEEAGTCPETQMTRDEGFFKIHESALQQCLDQGPISLGSLGTISTLEEALGLLWGSPTLFPDDEPRGPLDTARFLLARQVLVADCNYALFQSYPYSRDLLEEARSALSGTDCQGMEHPLRTNLRKHNLSGRYRALPDGFDPGPPTPGHAESIAQDITGPSGQSCQ